MLNNISLISKKFHNKTPFLAPLNFKLCRRGGLYTTTSKDLFSWFVMVCHDLLVAIFFLLFIAYLSFVRRLYTKKYQADNKTLTKCIVS